MKDLSSIDFKDNVRFVVRRELKGLGIKAPKNKGSKMQPQESCSESVFGNSLDQVPSVNVGEEFYCSVPKFLVDATKYLENHLGTEGLFRKSGSIQRQKILKQKIENGESISDVQAHDVASLLKQFFRQLPEPLLTNQLNECFAKSQRLDCENSCAQAILYLCLLLPLPHLHTLQFFMRFVAKVASHSKESKMGTSNLAIVLTPNLINNPKKENSSSSEKILKDQTSVIDTLLKNSTQIGLVPDYVFERAKMICGDDIDGLTSSGDELEDNQLRRGNSRMSRPRARTKSITGFVSGLGQRWKNSSTKTPGVVRASHRRSRSVKAELTRNKERAHSEYDHYAMQETRPKGDAELEHFVALCNQRRSLRQQNKRKPTDNSTAVLSPASKRRALLRELESNGISHPTRIVSASTQMFTTPARRLAPIQPLSDVVKNEHAAKLLLSGETQHVKVVDAMNYVPSPDTVHEGITCANIKNVSTPYDNVLESPVTTMGEPVRPQRRKATNAKKIPSPYDNMLEFPVSAMGDPIRPQRRKVTRRHSSGATRCFSASPRHRPSTQQDAPVIKEGAPQLATSTGIPGDDRKENAFSIMECSHMSVAAELVQLGKSPLRVIYTGSAEKKYPGRHTVHTNMTPCKYHNGTPPAPVPRLVMTELRNGLIDTEL